MHAPADLHNARVGRGLDFHQLSVMTSLSPAVLQAIDEGRFGDLPAGIYARAYVRAFAAAVALDPGATLATVEHLLPAAADPLPAMRAAVFRRPSSPGRSRWMARAADVLFLLGLDAVIVLFVSLASGIALDRLPELGVALAAPCVVPVAAYAIFFGVLAGRTPGEWLCNCPAPRPVRILVRSRYGRKPGTPAALSACSEGRAR